MSSWDDDDEPRLDERRASAPDVPRHGRKKKTRRWCKGKVGVEHRTEDRIDVRAVGYAPWREDQPCYRPYWMKTWWICSHIRVCTVCGKILKHGLDDECPDFTNEVTRSR